MTTAELEDAALAAWAGRRQERSVSALIDRVRTERLWAFSVKAWRAILEVLIREAEGGGGQ